MKLPIDGERVMTQATEQPRNEGLKTLVADDEANIHRILETRLQTGEPYLLFSDTVNRMMPKHHRDLGLKVSTSNLCSEITLPTGIDHLGNDRTAVCCLSSLNLETWDEWNGDKQFIEDVMRFLDNVLQGFIDTAGSDFARATAAPRVGSRWATSVPTLAKSQRGLKSWSLRGAKSSSPWRMCAMGCRLLFRQGM